MINRLAPLLFTVFIACNNTPKIAVDINDLQKSADTLRSFTISNSGSGTLIIEDFTASCECTALNLRKGQKISPNDSLTVKVRINKKEQDADNAIFIMLKTNANPRLTSFHFKP